MEHIVGNTARNTVENRGKGTAKTHRSTLTWGLVVTLALGGGAGLAQTPIRGTVPLEPGGELSDSARFERYSALATFALPDAVRAAQDALGSAALPTEVELDEEDDYLVWEITFAERTVVVDVGSGEVLAISREDSDEDPALARVSLLEAVEIAQATVGLDAFPESVELDEDDDALVWEIEFGAQEVTVDATTGAVLSSELDD